MHDAVMSRGAVVARLAPGVAPAAADAELDTLERRLDVTAPGRYRPIGMQVTPLRSEVVGVVGRSLWLLFAAVGLVLAAACANVANLFLARTVARTQEVVTRAALGAGPGRLVRQFLCESLLVTLAAGVAGALVAWWGVDVLARLGADRIPRAHEIALDWRAFVFLFTVCLVCAVAVGLLPAVVAANADIRGVTQEAGVRSTGSSRHSRIRDGLVVAEVALAFVLACGVAGVIRELIALGRMTPGVITENVVTLHLTPRAPDRDYFAIEERVRQIPGVAGAGFIQMVPLQNWGWLGDLNIKGRPREERPQVELRTVTPGYFAALGIPVRGRVVTAADAGDARAIMVNETFARRYLHGEDPLRRETDRGPIVGVAGDVYQERLDVPVVPEIYQIVSSDAGIASDLGMTLVVRGSGAIEPLIPALRAAVREINPVVAIFNVRTMAEVVDDSLWELNLYRWAVGLFAALALVLAAIGLYGVMAYSVSSRTREFAVRLALGADPGRVARLVVGRGGRLALLGVAAGVVAAFTIVAAVRTLPASLRPDPVTLAVAAALLVGIALLASLVPARRVTRVSPSTALRG
jgi:predicted permease